MTGWWYKSWLERHDLLKTISWHSLSGLIIVFWSAALKWNEKNDGNLFSLSPPPPSLSVWEKGTKAHAAFFYRKEERKKEKGLYDSSDTRLKNSLQTFLMCCCFFPLQHWKGRENGPVFTASCCCCLHGKMSKNFFLSELEQLKFNFPQLFFFSLSFSSCSAAWSPKKSLFLYFHPVILSVALLLYVFVCAWGRKRKQHTHKMTNWNMEKERQEAAFSLIHSFSAFGKSEWESLSLFGPPFLLKGREWERKSPPIPC